MSIFNLVGQTLGQYELRELLGVGGMGAVYRAYQTTLRREVAIKILSSNLAGVSGYIERFNREAQTAAALEDNHIVPIYDFGTQQGVSYVVMRLLTGGTLGERVAQRVEKSEVLASLGEIAHLLNQLAGGLDYAHSRGVIHRDIKASNIMFDTKGTAFIVDFGIARLLESTSSLTNTNLLMGTPSYMSPEQWRNESSVPATDQYALGVMIYLLVSGKLPFEATTPYGLMSKHLNETPTSPHVFRQDTPDSLTPVLQRAMAKQPEDRFPTVTDFAQAFSQAITGHEGRPTQFFTYTLQHSTAVIPRTGGSPALTPTLRPRYTRPALWGIGAAVLALVILMIVLASYGREPSVLELEQTQVALDITKMALSNIQRTPNENITPTPSDTTANITDSPTVAALVIISSMTPTFTSTSTETPTLTATSTPTNTPPATDTAVPTDTATATQLPSPTPTDSPTLTPTESPTATASYTATSVPTQTATSTAIPTLTSSPTRTAIPTVTQQPSPTITNTAVPILAISQLRIVFGGYVDNNPHVGTTIIEEPRGNRPVVYDDLNFLTVVGDLSPDGMYLAYDNCTSNRGIYVARIDGTDIHKVVSINDDYCVQVSWSPDGKKLAYGATDGSLQIVNIASSSSTVVVKEKVISWLSWSPSGDEIAYESGAGNDRQIFITDLDGNTRQLTTPEKVDGCTDVWAPSWSPDGNAIAFTACNFVYSISPDGSNIRLLTNNNAYSPRWSPDGLWVYYLDGTLLMRVSGDGSEQDIVGELPYYGQPFSIGIVADEISAEATMEATEEPSTGATLTVRVESANLRGGPGTEYQTVGRANQGEIFPILAQAAAQSDSSIWYLIELPNGDQAWIFANTGTVSPNGNQIEEAATIPAPSMTQVPQTNNSGGATLDGTWRGMNTEVTGDLRTFTVVIEIQHTDGSQTFTGVIYTYWSGGGLAETQNIVETHIDGSNVQFKDGAGRYFWGAIQNNQLSGFISWDCYQCSYWGTFSLSS